MPEDAKKMQIKQHFFFLSFFRSCLFVCLYVCLFVCCGQSVLTKESGSELGVRRIPRSFPCLSSPQVEDSDQTRALPQSRPNCKQRKKVKTTLREITSDHRLSHPGRQSRSTPPSPPHPSDTAHTPTPLKKKKKKKYINNYTRLTH